MIGAICSLLPSIPVTHALSPAGRITSTLGNGALTHKHPLTLNTATFPSISPISVPSHTHFLDKHNMTFLFKKRKKLKRKMPVSFYCDPCVVPCGGALSCCEPLRRTPEASISAQTQRVSQRICSLALLGSDVLPSAHTQKKIAALNSNLKCFYLDAFFLFKKNVCHCMRNVFLLLSKDSLTPSWSIVEGNSGIFQKGEKKVLLFHVGSKLASSED